MQATFSRLGYGGAPNAAEVGRNAWVEAGTNPETVQDARVTVTFGTDGDRGKLDALLRKYGTNAGW